MKKIEIKKPDIKAGFQKIKSLRWSAIKDYYRKKQRIRLDKIEQRKNSAFGQKMQVVNHYLNLFSIFLHGGWAILINYIIEAMSRHSVMAAWEYSCVSTKAFLYNAFMIFATFSIVYLFKRRAFCRIILSCLWLVLGIVNGIMLSRRVTPFNAQDLKTVAEGLSLFSNYFSSKELTALGVGAVLLLLLLIFLWRNLGKFSGKMNYILSIAVVAASFGGYGVLTDYVIENRIVSTYFANIAFAYQDYGLPYCFAASIFNTGISEPNGYTKELMAEISEDGAIVQSTSDAKVLPNVIFVQLESFFDVSEFEALQTSQDALPNLRKMAAEYSSGYCQVPSIGAGTANTEFEVVTGMNLRFFGPGEYPYKTYLKEKTAESAATAFSSFGYGTHAIHNHSGNFYSRAKVFNNIGFDTFVCKEFMNFDTTETGWAKDEVLLTHIQDCLDSTEQQDFIFTISVQGHGSYPEEHIIEEPHLTTSGLTEEKNCQWEYYVNQVYEMDQFAADLVQMMDERGEPAVVVFYGDHLPTLGLTEADVKSGSLFNTNYVIWDNIGLEKQDGTIPTYQLMSEVMNRIGLHGGTVFNFHQQRKNDEDQADYLMDLEVLQYDLLYGKQYVYNGNPVITEGHIEMGKRDTKVLYLTESLDGEYTIVGENFTKWTYAYINGEKQSRKFVNDTTIKLKKSHLEDWDVVTFSQVGSSNTIFRTSEEYVYLDGRLVQYTDELRAEKLLQQGVEGVDAVNAEIAG